MLDQLVASKGRVFIGTFFSTLLGYINRMRGYYMTKHKIDGYLEGVMESYYFTPVSESYNMLLMTLVEHTFVEVDLFCLLLTFNNTLRRMIG